MSKLLFLLLLPLIGCLGGCGGGSAPVPPQVVNCDVITATPIPTDILRTCEDIPDLVGKKFGDVVIDDVMARRIYAQCKAMNQDKLDFIKRMYEAQKKACAASAPSATAKPEDKQSP